MRQRGTEASRDRDSDGVSDFSDTHENNAGSFSTDQMILAGHQYGHYAPGSMDDFRIYRRTLTEEEIRELYKLRG